MPSVRKKHKDSKPGLMWDLQPYKKGVLLHLRVQPNAPRNGISRPINGVIQLKLNAPPVKGAANKSCIQYLSSFFHLAKSRIEIIRGLRSREKWIWLKETDPSALIEVLGSKTVLSVVIGPKQPKIALKKHA